MSRNRFQLNASKTEVIWLRSSRRLKKLMFPAVVLSGCLIPLSTSARSLGVIVNSGLTFSDHVSKQVNNCHYQLRQKRSMQRSSTHALCSSTGALPDRLLQQSAGGISGTLLNSLDGVMRAAACLILQLQYRDHVTTLIRDRLHWLDAASRITYKICVLIFCCRNSLAPRYLVKHCVPVRTIPGSIETSVRSGE